MNPILLKVIVIYIIVCAFAGAYISHKEHIRSGLVCIRTDVFMTWLGLLLGAVAGFLALVSLWVIACAFMFLFS